MEKILKDIVKIEEGNISQSGIKTYLFIDESGDPAFYATGNKCIVGKEGFKPMLMIGMIKLEDKKRIRNAILAFMNDLKNDPLYNTLPCINNPKGWYLHASYDNIEVQVKFIDFIRKLEGFKFFCIIGRKRLDVFHKRHNKNESEFYFDLISHLLKNRLNDENTFYQVLLSARTKTTQGKLKDSIDKALRRDNERRKKPKEIQYNAEIVQSKDTPELSIVDYLLWVLQRYIIKGDRRFYTALEEKYSLIIDLYDFDKYAKRKESNYYSSKNRFDLTKTSIFKNDGYV